MGAAPVCTTPAALRAPAETCQTHNVMSAGATQSQNFHNSYLQLEAWQVQMVAAPQTLLSS